jgi:hypothetical protein
MGFHSADAQSLPPYQPARHEVLNAYKEAAKNGASEREVTQPGRKI